VSGYARANPTYDVLSSGCRKLKIGILEADDLDAGVVGKYGSYTDMFQELLLSVSDQLTFKKYQVTELEYPEKTDECDAYLITGSKHSVYENEIWINRLKKFSNQLYQKKIKQIGICFGHQLVAQALGGRAEKSAHGWGIGHMSYHIKQKQDWMRPGKENVSLLASHQDQVVQLPPQARLIASNDFCVNAAFQLNDSVLCFQGHPEFSREYLEYIMNKRREQLGEKIYNNAKKSLAEQDEHKLVAQWIVNFLDQ